MKPISLEKKKKRSKRIISSYFISQMKKYNIKLYKIAKKVLTNSREAVIIKI